MASSFNPFVEPDSIITIDGVETKIDDNFTAEMAAEKIRHIVLEQNGELEISDEGAIVSVRSGLGASIKTRG